MYNLCMKKALSIIIIIFWGLFIWIDRIWSEVIAGAVADKLGTYGELYGPLSYFRPAALYSALTATMLFLILNNRKNG